MNRIVALERAFVFSCCGAALVGLIHNIEAPARRGVLVVVGGPQYRAGSHRQFVLLARALAECGVPVMRFDYRGIGDSDEPFLGFEALDRDIAGAIDAFFAQCPSLREIALWGLCDAASAILFYAHKDPRVAGVVLLNPWARTQVGEARAYLRHYYGRRVLDPKLWRAVALGRVNIWRAMLSFLRMVAQRLHFTAQSESQDKDSVPLPERMAAGLALFSGPVLLIMSGQDLTAREFEDAARASRQWRKLMAATNFTRRDLDEADHTFSCRIWHDKVVTLTSEWLQSW